MDNMTATTAHLTSGKRAPFCFLALFINPFSCHPALHLHRYAVQHKKDRRHETIMCFIPLPDVDIDYRKYNAPVTRRGRNMFH